MEDTDDLRILIEREQTAHLWTEPYQITPRLVNEVFGDGKQLLALYPIMHRPNHFVVRIDSKTDTLYAADWLDPILDAIEEQFHEWPWAAMYGLTWHEDEAADNDSRIGFTDGVSWEDFQLNPNPQPPSIPGNQGD